MDRHINESQIEECYEIFLTTTKEYYGTIKVSVGADLSEKLERAYKIMPKLKSKKYLQDYTMVYKGRFKKVH